MAKEAAMGASVAAVLGGGTVGVPTAINAINENRINNAYVRVWTDAANKNTTQTDGVERYSIKQTSKMAYSDQMELIEKGGFKRSDSLYIGTPYGIKGNAIFSDAPFAMNQSDYRKSRRESGNNKNYSSHSVPKEFFDNMPQHLTEAPMFIVDGNKVTAITPYAMKGTDGKDSYVIAGILKDQQMENDTVNQVKSAYPLDNLAVRVNRAAENGVLVITNKNKAAEMLTTVGVQPAEVSNILNLAKGSITNDSPIVNTDTIGVVRDEYTATLDEALVNELDEMARRLGLRVEFTDGIESNKNADASIQGNVVRIDKNTKRPILQLVGHEITHHLQRVSPEAYAKFERLALKRIGDKYVNDTYLRYKSAGVKYVDTKMAIEEAVADYAGALVYDGKVLDKFIFDNKRDKGILGTVRSAVTYLKDRLTGKSKVQAQVAEAKLTNAINDVNLENKNTAQTDGIERFVVKYDYGVTQEDVDTYISKAYTNENTKPYIKLFAPTERLVQDVSGDVDISEYTHVLRDNDIRHIRNSHGEETTEKYPITENDIALIPYIVKEYDKVFYKTNHRGEPGLVYVKVMPDNVVYFVEAITQQYDKEKLLVNKQMIKTGIDNIPNLYGLKNAINKKQNNSQYLADLQKIRKAYVQDDKGNYSNNSISQPDPTVKEQFSLKIPETDADTPNADIAELLDMLDTEEASEATKLRLEELREKYGVIPKGEKPFRDVQVPKQTAKDKYVSQTVRTILEAEATPDEMLPTIEKLIAEGEFSYDRYTDDAARADANAKIARDGWDDSYADWKKDAVKGTISKENAAIGWALYNNAANAGNMDTALNILSLIANNQRSAAQALQATRIIKKLSPEAQLYQVQKTISRMQAELDDKYGKRKRMKTASGLKIENSTDLKIEADTIREKYGRGKAPELKINEDLAAEFLKAKTQERRDEVLKEIYLDIGRQMPSTFGDKLDYFLTTYNSILVRADMF